MISTDLESSDQDLSFGVFGITNSTVLRDVFDFEVGSNFVFQKFDVLSLQAVTFLLLVKSSCLNTLSCSLFLDLSNAVLTFAFRLIFVEIVQFENFCSEF